MQVGTVEWCEYFCWGYILYKKLILAGHKQEIIFFQAAQLDLSVILLTQLDMFAQALVDSGIFSSDFMYQT
jgi:hypothetical protein